MTTTIRLITAENAYRFSESNLPAFAGNFGTMENRWGFTMYELDEYDRSYIKSQNVRLKDTERIFRADTERLRGMHFPMKFMVKINLEKNLVYFNRIEASEDDRIDFERKGVKLSWLNIKTELLPKTS